MTFQGFREYVSEERFEVFHQPIVHLDDYSVSHHEWLVRFDHEARLDGILRPAEISGAIQALDMSMLARAVLTLNANPDGPGIAINLSGASIDNPDFKRSVIACLTAYTAPPEKLIFELTETWNLISLEPAIDIMGLLKSFGHTVCLDDVGSGAASIRYLRSIPADWLKIDGEFVQAAFSCERERHVLKAILDLAAPLDAKCIAEGVENDELIQFVKDMGFDAAQGYGLGKPKLIDELVI